LTPPEDILQLTRDERDEQLTEIHWREPGDSARRGSGR
jgi:hypothetical protein